VRNRCVGAALVLAVLVLVLAACQPSEPDQTATPAGTLEPAIATPGATESSDSFVSPLVFDSPIATATAYPTPTAPTPASGKAVVRGGLFSSTTDMAVAETSVYLVRGIGPQRDEMPPVWSGPADGDIHGRTDKLGWFVINDVPPGVYYVTVWAPLDWVVLEDYKDSVRQPLALKAQADQVLDLGFMVISWP
jgi:hypothetical protein